jgi:hypothetical protein
MENSIQHYISCLRGSLNTGETSTVLLDGEFQLTNDLCSKVATILQKQESPFSGFLVVFYAFPSQNVIQVPWITTPRKRKYTGYFTEDFLQTTYMSVLP